MRIQPLPASDTSWLCQFRCVLDCGPRIRVMTEDHKPVDAEERQRIEAAGGFVAGGRVDGSLNISRALGDQKFKQVILFVF